MSALAEREPVVPVPLLGLDPPTQLADHLLPPLKRSGIPFDQAWELAMERICWPVSRRETRDWEAQLDATREGWRAAYDGEPATRPEWVLRGLAAAYRALALHGA